MVTVRQKHHPEPEALAAFAEGRIAGEERSAVKQHLAECETCSGVVAGAVVFRRQFHRRASRRARGWKRLLAGVIIALVAGAIWVIWRAREQRAPLQILAAAAPTAARQIEPRLTGMPWAAFRQPTRGAENDPSSMRLVGAAGVVLERVAGDPSPEARQAEALARLVTSNTEEARQTFERIAPAQRTASMWSDLAAAELVHATRHDAPERLKNALASCDAALRLDARHAPALFNRALTLEHFSLRDLTREGWNQYLLVDETSPWADEARGRLRRLNIRPPQFREELARHYDALTAGDLATARDLVDRFPQESRAWGEAEILPRWGAAFQAGQADAAKHLAVARNLGQALRERSGESLLSDAVQSIDRCAGATCLRLAQALTLYREGRITYRDGKPTLAEPLLRSAANQFIATGSPLSFMARYYTANTVFDQTRVESASRELDQLAGEIPAGYYAARAHVNWQQANCDSARSMWGPALQHLDAAIEGFTRLGERAHASFLTLNRAGSFTYIGETKLAWKDYVRALATIGQSINRDYRIALYALTTTTIVEKEWAAASSLLAIEIGSAAADPMLQVQALLRRALVSLRESNLQQARRDLQAAREIAGRQEDPSLREWSLADAMFVDGLLAADRGDQHSIEAITRAIEFHQKKGARFYLPDMLLARARGYRSRNDRRAAWADLNAALEIVERDRRTIPSGDIRAGMFDAATDLIETAASMSIEEGDAIRALHFIERGRARVLLDATGVDAVPVSADAWWRGLGDESVGLVFAPIDTKMHAFTVAGGNIARTPLAETPNRIQALAGELLAAGAAGDARKFRRTGSLLHDALIEPIRAQIEGKSRLVISGDADLLLLPYAALLNARTQQFLVERHEIVVAPSLAAHIAGKRRLFHDPPRRVLAIGDPRRVQTRLTYADHEAGAIARLYPENVLLTGASATTEAFLRETRDAEVIHFAGHARGADAGGEARLLLAATAGNRGEIHSSQIATMKLLRPRFAVLAACDTAKGERRRSEGAFSVARGFLIAGVPSVAATLWPLPDQDAMPFFVVLHAHLRRGDTPAAALRASQVEAIRQQRSPAVWSAVQLIGT